MGYRSMVAYKIDFHVADDWNVFLIEAKSKLETRMCFEDESLKVDHERHSVMFFADWVKWYPDYEDVKCHIALMELATDYNDRKKESVCSWLFKRMGESPDDYEEFHEGEPDWDSIDYARTINVSWQ